MRKAILMVAIGISLCLCASHVTADNQVSLDNYKLNASLASSTILLLEVDFTSGKTMKIDILITADRSIDVLFVTEESLAPILTGRGTFFYLPAYSQSGITRFDRQFSISTANIDQGKYYYYIEPNTLGETNLDVTLDVLVDYDGDGSFATDDSNPFTDNNWISVTNNRLLSLENGVSTLTSEVNSIKSNLATFKANTENNISTLQSGLTGLNNDYNTFKDSMLYELEGLNGLFDQYNRSYTAFKAQMGSELGTLRDDVDALQSELEAAAGAINETIDALSSSIDDFFLQMQSVKRQIGDTDGNVSDLETSFSAQLTAKTGQLNDSIKSLEAKELSDHMAQESTMDENLQKAMDEAASARNMGIGVGAVGIILALIALILGMRGRKGEPTPSFTAPREGESTTLAEPPIATDIQSEPAKPEPRPTIAPAVPIVPAAPLKVAPPPPITESQPERAAVAQQQPTRFCQYCGSKMAFDATFCPACRKGR